MILLINVQLIEALEINYFLYGPNARDLSLVYCINDLFLSLTVVSIVINAVFALVSVLKTR